MSKSLLLILGFLFIPFLAISQSESPTDLPNVIPPSPEVNALFSLREDNVTESTGHAQVSIPIFQKAISSSLSYNTSLNYNSSLLKLVNPSGWVGTGWADNFSNMVSRTVKGYPDEFAKSSHHITGILNLPDYWNYDNISTRNQEKFRWKTAGDSADKYDSNQDIFNFKSLGVSGSFILELDNNGIIQIKPLELSNKNLKFQIQYDYTNSKILSFKIRDTNNYVHYFTFIEEAYTERMNAVEAFGGYSNVSGQGSQYLYTSGWFLEKIVKEGATPSLDKIVLSCTYQNLGSGFTSNVSRTNRTRNDFGVGTVWSTMILPDEYNAWIVPAESELSYNTTSSDNLAPLRINFLDGTHLSFTTHPTLINPETNGKTLESVTYYDNTNEISKWEFDLTVTTKGRLFLDSLKKVSNNIHEPTTFNYKNKNDLPEALNFSVDQWGYYIEKQVVAYGFEREVENSRFTGFLTDIIYPTGGSQKYVYEPTTYSYDVDGLIPLEFCKVENQLNWNADSRIFKFNSSSSNWVTFNVLEEQEYNYKRILTNGTAYDFQNAGIEFSFSDGTTQTIGCDVQHRKITMPSGNVSVRIFSLTQNSNFDFDFGLGWKIFQPMPKQYLLGGGGVVSEIHLLDQNDPIKKLVNYNYMESNNISSGAVDGLHDQITKNYDETFYEFLLSSNCQVYNASQISLNTKINSLNFNSIGQNYVSFSKVERSETGLGKIITNYTSAKEYHNDPSYFTFPYRNPINLNHKIGLTKESITFNQENESLTQTNFEYSFIDNQIATHLDLNFVKDPWKRFFDLWQPYVNFNSIPDKPMMKCNFGCNQDCFNQYIEPVGAVFPYYFTETPLYQTHVNQIKKTEKHFFIDDTGNSEIVTQVTDFAYNIINYQLNYTSSTTSEGDVLEQKKYYSVDHNIPTLSSPIETGIRQDLVDANMFTTPILQESYRDGVLTSRVKYHYDEFEPNQFLLVAVSTQKGLNDPMESRLTYHKYDPYGNVLDVSKQDGTHVSYIWGYNKTLPIAKIEGLSYDELATKLNTTPAGLDSFDESPSYMNLINGLRNAFSISDPFMITTYEYDVGVGIKKVTDPRGRNMTYFYDDFNRLEYVKDHEGNILSENEYKYATQN